MLRPPECYNTFAKRKEVTEEDSTHQIEGIAVPLLGQGDHCLGAVGIFWEVK